MARVVLVPHHNRPHARDLANDAASWLNAHGHEPVTADIDLADRSQREKWLSSLVDVDLAVTFGGDGTLLSVIGTLAPLGVPMLGVNVGHLGYLTSAKPSDLHFALEEALSGRSRIDERMTLDIAVSVPGLDEVLSSVALNDAVVERVQSSTVVRLALELNGEPFTQVAADGLIISTPTGSTAYNLSARGPLVSPTVDSLIVTPVSPHSLFDRSLVLDPSTEIVVRVLDGRTGEAMVDGQSLSMLYDGATVRVTAGKHRAKIVALTEKQFENTLARKFRWTDD